MYRSIQPSFSSLAAAALAFALTCSLSAQQFTNGSFENWGPASMCGVNSPPDNWSGSSGSGASGVDEGHFVTCPHTIPAGAQSGDAYVRSYATLNGGEGIEQVVSGFTPGQSYTIRYHYAGSNRWGGIADGFWRVSLDGVGIDDTPIYSSLQTWWTQREVTFTATASSHAIRFRGYRDPSDSGSASLGLDQVAILQAASVEAFGQPCAVGNALTLSSDLPSLGTNWTLTGSNIEASATLAVFWFGDSGFNPGLDLTGFGVETCFAYTNVNLGAYVVPAASTATYTVAVPNQPAFVGTQLFAQMSAPSSGTTIGFTTSNGLLATLGS